MGSVLRGAGVDLDEVAGVATTERLATHPAVVGLGRPVTAWSPDRLAGVTGVTGSARVAEAVGTGSVAEAAALLAAGPGATLVVTKRASAHATVAVAAAVIPASWARR